MLINTSRGVVDTRLSFDAPQNLEKLAARFWILDVYEQNQIYSFFFLREFASASVIQDDTSQHT
jgi:hypothetical protein